MKKNLLKRLLAAVLACSLPVSAGISAFADDAGEPDLTTGKPWLASNMQGVVTAETETELKDDFYLYVNKDAILSYEIEPGYSQAGTITARNQDNTKDILALFTENREAENGQTGNREAESHDAKLALDMYDLFMDWEARDAAGVRPLREVIGRFEEVSSVEELTAYYTSVPFEEQVVLPFSFGYSADVLDSDVYIMNIASGGLLLGDSAEYSELTEVGAVYKEAYRDLAVYMLQRSGYTEEEARIKYENCLALETALAPYIFTSDETRDPDYVNRVNNYFTYEELEEAQGAVPILQVIDFCGYERKDAVVLNEPAWLEAFRDYYSDEHLDCLKDYAIVHTVLSMSSYLDRECFQHLLDCSNTVSGASGFLSDEEYAANAVISLLGWPVVRLYCERYFTEQDKENVSNLVSEIVDAYSDMLAGEDFISEETRRKAIEKLSCMTAKVLYPDSWEDYSYEKLNFDPASEGGSLIDAVYALSRCEMDKAVEEFSKPVNKEKWKYSLPTTVNAFYSPTDNSVNMLAAFCRGELYSSDMPLEEQYAKLGMVIAHEISHSFDGTGSQFDKDGNLSCWWTEEDQENFNQKIQAIADYADTIYCWDGTHVNGAIITGEACADMGAMACMLHIAENIEDFDYDLFFTEFARLWSGIRTYNNFIARLRDEHPPEFFRVNAVLQQFDEFLDFYGIAEGDGMYLAPEKRVAIW